MVVETTTRRSVFSIAKTTGHATPELLRRIQEVLELEKVPIDQYTLYDHLVRLPSSRIRDVLLKNLPLTKGNLPSPAYFNAWAVLYALKWKEIQDPIRLKYSTDDDEHATVQFITAVTTQNGEKHKLFMKGTDLSKLHKKDSNLLDNLNGLILSWIVRQTHDGRSMYRHLMTYLTSFASMIEDPPEGDTLEWPIQTLTNVKSTKCPFSSNYQLNTSNQKRYLTSVFDMVDGVPLSSLLFDEEKVGFVLKGLPSFCATLRLLGMKYGMMHNDLHTGNIFIDQHTMELVLIDYGRVTFPSDVVVNANISRHILDEKNRNFLHMTPTTYESLTSAFPHAMKANAGNELYATHLLDFATMITNIHFDICNIDGIKWVWFNRYFLVTTSGWRDGSYITIPTSMHDIETYYLEAITAINTNAKEDDKLGMILMAEGLFIMSSILLYAYENVPALRKATDTSMTVLQQDMDRGGHSKKLLSNRIRLSLSDVCETELMYYYFQFMNTTFWTPEILNQLVEKLTENTNVVEVSPTLQNLILDTMIGGMEKMYTDDIPLRNNANANDNLLNALEESQRHRPPIVKPKIFQISAIATTAAQASRPIPIPITVGAGDKVKKSKSKIAPSAR